MITVEQINKHLNEQWVSFLSGNKKPGVVVIHPSDFEILYFGFAGKIVSTEQAEHCRWKGIKILRSVDIEPGKPEMY